MSKPLKLKPIKISNSTLDLHGAHMAAKNGDLEQVVLEFERILQTLASDIQSINRSFEQVNTQ